MHNSADTLNPSRAEQSPRPPLPRPRSLVGSPTATPHFQLFWPVTAWLGEIGHFSTPLRAGSIPPFAGLLQPPQLIPGASRPPSLRKIRSVLAKLLGHGVFSVRMGGAAGKRCGSIPPRVPASLPGCPPPLTDAPAVTPGPGEPARPHLPGREKKQHRGLLQALALPLRSSPSALMYR